MVTVIGGRGEKVEFSAARMTEALVTVAQRRAKTEGSVGTDFSLFSLPLQTQNVTTLAPCRLVSVAG